MPAAAQRHLPKQEAIGRAEALLRHYGRGAEHHHQPDEDQQQRDREQPFVDADALGHLFAASRSAASDLLALLLPCRQLPDKLLEDPSAMLVTVELVEAGAGRGEQHNIARGRSFAGALHGRFQSSRLRQSRRLAPAIRSSPPPHQWCKRASRAPSADRSARRNRCLCPCRRESGECGRETIPAP